MVRGSTVGLVVAAVGLLGGLLGGAPARADAERAPPGGTAVRLPAAPREDLVDCRSTLVAHEARVALGEPWTHGSHTLVFERDRGDRLLVSRRSEGEAASAPAPLKSVPGLLVLKGPGGPYGLSVRDDEEGTGVVVSSAQGAELRLGEARGWLVDSDRDGLLGSPGDGYVAPQSRTVGPWAGEGWSADAGARWRETAPGRWERRTAETPYPEDADHSAAWRFVQWRRQQCGVPPLRYEPSLEPAMRAHAEYLRRNGVFGHEEDPARPGFTEEGARAGQECILAPAPRTLLESLLVNLATLYHRDAVLQPGLEATAMIVHAGTFLLNHRARSEGPWRAGVVVYPPHGMSGVRRRFHETGEVPMPVEGVGNARNELGTAVTVFVPVLEEAGSLASPPALAVRPLDRKGRLGPPLATSLHWPGFAPATGAVPSNYGEVGATPHAVLAPSTTYRCRAVVDLPPAVRLPDGGSRFAYVWEFTTE